MFLHSTIQSKEDLDMNVYQMVTEKVIKQLEQGVVPWRQPWATVRGAYNVVTGKSYSLLNTLLLAHSGKYATFKQWTVLGQKLKPGSKSEQIVFWKIYEKDDERIPVLRYYNVFHESQLEQPQGDFSTVGSTGSTGSTGSAVSAGSTQLDKDDLAEQVIFDYCNRESLQVKHGSVACYNWDKDYITVPSLELFNLSNEYYSTCFHEMIHSTGATQRLHRNFSRAGYAQEELIAELGSIYLMHRLGLEVTETFDNSVSYLNSWIEVLKRDARVLVICSGKAEKAANYVLGDDYNDSVSRETFD